MHEITSAKKCTSGEYNYYKDYRLQAEELPHSGTESRLAMLALKGAADGLPAIKARTAIGDVDNSKFGHAYYVVRFMFENECGEPESPTLTTAFSPNGFIKPSEPLFHLGKEIEIGYFLPYPDN